jgi:hypothetical protein
MNDLKEGELTLTVAEICDAPYSSQVTLKLLMEKGAPIIGCCVLCLDARYHWFVEEDKKSKAVTYRWTVKD